MVVEMAVTGTVVRIEHRVASNGFGNEMHQADMLLVCELERGGAGLTATSEGPEGMTLGVLGALVSIEDDWGLPGLGEVKVGDLVYVKGGWHSPGSHDMEQEMRFLEATRDWYSLESWDAGEAGRLEVRSVEISGYDVRRFIVREARWERLTEEWCSMRDPIHDDAGWNVHRMVVGGCWSEGVAWDREAVAALDREAESGWREMERQSKEDSKERRQAERNAERNALEDVAKLPEVQAQKEAARQLAKRGQKGKGGKRKRRT